jgi:hypothetical protein
VDEALVLEEIQAPPTAPAPIVHRLALGATGQTGIAAACSRLDFEVEASGQARAGRLIHTDREDPVF